MEKKAMLIKENEILKGKVGPAVEEIRVIKATLGEVENAQNAAHVAERNLPDLLERRQALQADIATGKVGKQTELESLNQEIAKIQEVLAYHNETVSGLQRKLQLAENAHNSLNASIKAQGLKIIEALAEEIHIEYLGHARELLSRFNKLQALANVYGSKSGRTAFGSGNLHQYFLIPQFKLNPNGVNAGPEWPPAREVHHRGRPTPEALQDVSRILSELGVIV
jgi:hypothetical protein